MPGPDARTAAMRLIPKGTIVKLYIELPERAAGGAFLITLDRNMSRAEVREEIEQVLLPSFYGHYLPD